MQLIRNIFPEWLINEVPNNQNHKNTSHLMNNFWTNKKGFFQIT